MTDGGKGIEGELAARAKALASLADLLKGVTPERVASWAAANASAVPHILRDRYFGKIRWPKSIGRSLGVTLASGFEGQDWYHWLNWEVGPDGEPIDIGKWAQTQSPSFWDLPDDGDFFQVGYGGWAVRPWENAVVLKFSGTQPWDTASQLRYRLRSRVIVPDEIHFYFGGADYAFLEDATIVEVPIRFF